MSSPVFVDAAYAAEMLHMPIESVLDLIKNRRIKTFGGHASNPFVRSADILSLVREVGVPDQSDVAPRKAKSSTARVQARLTADARWADITDADIELWAVRADASRKQAARTAVNTAIVRLRHVLQTLDENGQE